MKHFYKLFASLALVCIIFNASIAQNILSDQPEYLGKSDQLLNQFTRKINAQSRNGQALMDLKITDGKVVTVRVNTKDLSGDNGYLIGEIDGKPSSSLYLRYQNKSLEGNIVFRDSGQAYEYFTDDQGDTFVKEVDINQILCVNYEDLSEHDEDQKTEKSDGEDTNQTATSRAATELQSYPGANGVVLLDFDGHYVSGTPWNNGWPINAQPSGMSDTQIIEAWEIVSEDFRPFNVNITTNEAIFNSYPKNRRMRCIITPTNTAAPGAGGVAYIGSFNWNDDTPCWSFLRQGKSAGEVSSHEIGHTFGLGHDGRTYPSETYFGGHGNWAPIMGVSYYKNVTQWSRGEYNYANNSQNDLASISSSTYGVGYRNDDHGNSTSAATAIKIGANGTVAAAQNNGVIERTADVDLFSFTTGGGNVQLNFNPASRHANLDILVKLYNSSGSLISTHNPTGLTASINTTLSAGNYFVSVDGTGAGSPASNGYSDYGSLGYYSISGHIPASSGNQSPVVSITSPANGATFNSPANITINAGASDPDGSVSKVEFFRGAIKIGEDTSAPYSFVWTNVAAGTYSLRAKATDNSGAVTLSSAVSVTIGTQNNCNAPSGLYASNVTSSSASISWAAQPGATQYLVWWKSHNASGWNKFFSNTNSGRFYDLQPNTTYYFAVSAYCSGKYTANSATKSFTTQELYAAYVYPYCDYSGYSVGLAPGSYTLAQLREKGIYDNDISSLQVRNGYEIELYRYDYFQGGSWWFTSNYSCLYYLNFDNTASSVIVRPARSAASEEQQAASKDSEPQFKPAVSVAPNPFIDKLAIKFEGDHTAEIRVIDTFGKEVLMLKGVDAGRQLDLSGLSPGVYILKITTGNQVNVQRVVKQSK